MSSFLVVCGGLQHIDPNQSVVLTGNGGNAPLDGAIVSVSTATLTPLSIPWGVDSEGCPDPAPSYAGGVLSHVVLRAPTAAGIHTFTIQWSRSLTPEAENDANAFARAATSVDFSVRVSSNTAPMITVPASFTVEGDTRGGWTSTWIVSASDAEDDLDPTPTCVPTVGGVLPLGPTTVTCTVTDGAGATASDHFDVTVVDRTAPRLSGFPSDIDVSTSDPDGRAVSFASPNATDVVDGSPTVACSPVSGSVFAVGTSTVTCTATDERGNQASGSFRVTVRSVAPHEASAVWLEPVASGSWTFVVNRGRTIPVKVRLFVNGHARPWGDADLRVTPCGGGATSELPLTSGGGRWNVSLDTSGLDASCYTVAATIDGLLADSFTLELRGGAAAAARPKRMAPTVP